MRLTRRPLRTVQVDEMYDLPPNWTKAAAPGTHRTGLGTMRPPGLKPGKVKRRTLRSIPWQGADGNAGP